MPTFCRHSRLVENCSICSKKALVDLSAVKSVPDKVKRERRAAAAPTGATKRQTARGMTVRRLTRAEDDGYDHDLLPGLRASADALRLAQELVISAQRLEALAGAASPVTDAEEALWQHFQQAVIGRPDGAATTWASGENPAPAAPGPRGIPEADQEALWQRHRAWASAGGGQLEALTSGATGSPESRFDRAFERLSSSSLPRYTRLEFLLTSRMAGVLADLEVWTPRLGDAPATDPVLIAAKRVFGIGDPLLLQRRLRAACDAAGVPVAAADVALWNWSVTSENERVYGDAEPDAERVAAAAAAFGASPPAE